MFFFLFFSSHKSWLAFWSTCWARGVLFSTTHPQDILGKRAFLYMILSWSSLILLYQSTCTARIHTHINATYLLHPLCVPKAPTLHLERCMSFIEIREMHEDRCRSGQCQDLSVRCNELTDRVVAGRRRDSKGLVPCGISSLGLVDRRDHLHSSDKQQDLLESLTAFDHAFVCSELRP
jgi:hypothetical protein